MRVKRFYIKKIGGEDFVYVNVKVSNPDKPELSKRLDFLVDTGAAGCALPKAVADELNIEPKGIVDVGLADGRYVRAAAAYILLESSGRRVYTWAVINEGFEPILGIDVMRILKIHIDVKERETLIPLRRLKVNALITMNNNFNIPKNHNF